MGNKDYFKELYECKKKLFNVLQTLQGIKEAFEVRDADLSKEIYELRDELEAMEVDLEE